VKTITAKEFQLRQSAILKDVAKGNKYQVTFHRKPLVVLSPALKATNKNPKPGTKEAFIESLKHTSPAKNLPDEPDYKAIRREGLRKKYGP
jgi:antitoxin (DNA-binding transcriptional repressor) of toxin-antitoxin stability system